MFFPAHAVHENSLKTIEAYMPKAAALQNAKIRRALTKPYQRLGGVPSCLR
ncbi:hypothetical protein RGR602_CH03333 [Rhizobium gallicum bv. gallicum R602sp]|uniref:Uncharacterized protein n=1 Tax=Rhizobium gallicum bv. gallicum R602sp TaxID=1041138 RepID=A0A0B4X834_9HYPH|nr:hypothetical protein RGR602_CH03333 [Rhizobium gallicum bv. gallicum R602sp]